MPCFLRCRRSDLRERMDDPDCDTARLENTYRHFQTVNSALCRWNTLYRRHLRPVILAAGGRTFTLLDIGFGGGDVASGLASLARRDRVSLDITAIDTDPRACRYVKTLFLPDSITFRLASAGELLREGRRFDFVISNHLVHHLGDEELLSVLSEARQLSRHCVLFSDIERSDVGYLLFALLTRPAFRNSFIRQDGLTSIRRSYALAELRGIVPRGWQVNRIFPLRLLLSYRHE